ncbi:MAG: cytochrome c [Gemmatimonadales bacterium]
MQRWTVGLLLGLGALSSCTSAEEEPGEESALGAELSAFELENGIGPVKEAVTLGPLDPALAEQGRQIFDTKCSMCHKMDTTYVGPPIGEVTARRTPAYILNMILNPQEMVEKHPVAKQLLAERMTFMPNQQLTLADARAVLEYLRPQSKGGTAPPKED